ncbi:MAG TPA: hypothetical protein VFX98_18450 [Longimicrobiaceae bacterium]|nr:hypothetical protein [Longimicrobiaceae bacterium]
MSHRTPTAALTALLPCLAIAATAHAQSFSITRNSLGQPQLVAPSGRAEDLTIAAGGGPLTLTFQCRQDVNPPVDCTLLSAVLPPLANGTLPAPLLPASPTQTVATLQVPQGTTGDLTLRIGSVGVVPALRLGGDGGGEADPQEVEVVRRREMICAELAGVRGGYSQGQNRAVFVVATDGFVIGRPPLPVDENDLVTVHVVGDPDVLQTVKVERTSAIRGVGTARFLGEGVIGGIRRQAFTGDCGIASAEVTDFDSGEGIFTVTTLQDRRPVPAPVSFRVNPLYNGAFSFGPVLSNVRDREYGTLADSTIVETRTGTPTGRYVLSYTHFIWGPRDVEKSSFGLRSFNPMLGISLTRPLDSVFLGGAIDLMRGDFFIVGGVHGTEVTRLDPESGLQVGDRLPSGFTDVPTREEWDWDWYYGVTVDLRAAVKLFGNVISGG